MNGLQLVEEKFVVEVSIDEGTTWVEYSGYSRHDTRESAQSHIDRYLCSALHAKFRIIRRKIYVSSEVV